MLVQTELNETAYEQVEKAVVVVVKPDRARCPPRQGQPRLVSDIGKRAVFGLGKRKNLYFREHLEREGVAVFDSTIALLHQLRRMKVKLALASSSRNAEPVLAAAKLTDLFDVRVDGNDLGRLGLKGKPAPDLFLLAAKQLDVSPSRAVVFEDAISGVAAGCAGDFAHVVGVDRAGTPEALRKSGADIVVPDLAFLEIQGGPS
jgi:alpha,alpha-trehalase